jgi:hypothetical protein
MRYLARMLVLGVASTLVAGALTAQSCRPMDDRGKFMLNALKNLMVTTDGHVAASRDFERIPVVDSASVVLVTDTRICDKALKAYNTGIPKGAQGSTSVYVVKVGTVYVVLDPTRMAGEWAVEMVMDSRFNILSRYGS